MWSNASCCCGASENVPSPLFAHSSVPVRGRSEHCWRKIKNDYLKHIGDMNMKKEEKFVIDDSQNYNDMFSKKERMQINKATKPLENK